MHVLFVCDPPVGKPGTNVGGVHAVVSHLRHHIEAAGDKFSLITGEVFDEVPAGVDAYEYLCGKMDAIGFDAVHIVTFTRLGLLARRYCLERKLAYTQTYDTQIPEYLQVRHGVPATVAYAYMRWSCRSASHVIVPTPTMKARLEENGIGRVVVNGHGVDTELFRPACEGGFHDPQVGADFAQLKAKGPVLLYVGRITPEKRPEDFLKLRLGGRPHTKVVVGGVSGGMAQEELQKLDPEALFVGVKTGAALADYYRGADCFVFPSTTDTFGLVMLEAISCGTPVAAYPVIGSVDVVTDPKIGALHEDLEVAVDQALKLNRDDCRAHALQRTWAASVRGFASHFVQARSRGPVYADHDTPWGNMSWDELEAVVDRTALVLFSAEPAGPYDPKRGR